MSRATNEPLRVIDYHDATKHHRGRYARSLGYLDWETQPSPFRRYGGAPLISLPIPVDDPTGPYASLFEAPGRDPAALCLGSVSLFFYLSLAISAWKQAGASRWSLRCNPSSGNLHPTEGYALLPAIPGLADEPAVYHYAPRVHALERRAMLPRRAWQALREHFGEDAFFVGLSSILWREAWKYGERAYRYCQHDVGHALAALWFAAAALDWRLEVVGELGDEDVAALLGLNRLSESGTSAEEGDAPQQERRSHPHPVSYCPPARSEVPEPEEPDLLAAVRTGKAPDALERAAARRALALDFDARVRTPLAESVWIGTANRLSPAHVHWPIIDAVASEARRPRRAALAVGLVAPARRQLHPEPALPAADPVPAPSAMQIIRRRRSAVEFDGETRLALPAFCRMMTRSLPSARLVASERASVQSARSPFDALPAPPRVHLLLFVHRVDGLPPGIYLLVRDASAEVRLRAALHSSYAWTRPEGVPVELPLCLLHVADCRSAARQLSLDQAIAGDSAFSLGMLADFESAGLDSEPWAYRELFWEAGCIGQVLYLEAEAAGVRATGIGAYFDDWVHETVGIRDPAFQSLYHFTVGGPLDDPRITTLPAYESGAAREPPDAAQLRSLVEFQGR